MCATQVVSVFLSTTFDPYVAAKMGSGISRLAFATHDEEPADVPLANLSAPVVFSLPATNYTLRDPAGRGAPKETESACIFWDERLNAYRCAAMSGTAKGRCTGMFSFPERCCSPRPA